MEKRILGKTGLAASVLGFGAAEIGYEQASVETVERLLGSALDAGLNVIDTAECYLESEELIGRTVAARRNDYLLFTKCGHAAGFDFSDWDVRLLENSIDRSLGRLRTDRLDLVQLHSCTEEMLRQGDVINVLQQAREQGKTRFIGYSGDGQAAHYAVHCGAFDTLQTSLSIADQQAIDLTLPVARERGIGVIAKRPIANAVWRHSAKPDNPYVHPYWDRLQHLDYEFLRTNPSEATGTALRFTLSVPGVHTAIVGTTKPGRWRENAELLAAGPLPPTEFEAIRKRWHEAVATGAADEWEGQT